MDSPMRILLLLIAAISLVSCAQGPPYPQGPADPSQSARFVQLNKEGGFLSPTNYILTEIDGMPCGKAVRFPDGEKGIAVTPGNHEIGATLHRSVPGEGVLTATATIPMKVEAGKVYEVSGTILSTENVYLKILDSSSKRQVSATVKAETTHRNPIMIPIVIPISN